MAVFPTRRPQPAAPPLLLAALGGNALLRRGEPPTPAAQAAAARAAAASIARAARAAGPGTRIVMTHGNGPQVGLLATALPTTPLDVLDAQTAGWLGVVLANALDKALIAESGKGDGSVYERAAVVVTRVAVDAGDPALLTPSKPVGPVLTPAQADAARSAGFAVVAEPGGGARRAVPSPTPVAVLEAASLRLLADAGVPLVCGGGGGVPVVVRGDGSVEGVDAVIDKDALSALLATSLGASALLLLTDEAAVWDPDAWLEGRRVPVASPLTAADADALAERLPAGSMRPKVRAAAAFARGGGVAAIGGLGDADRLLSGEIGTLVVA